MNYLVEFVTAVIGLVSAVYLFSKWRYSYWKRKGIAQLEPEFFYGNLKSLAKGDTSLAETFLAQYNSLKALGVKYGGLYSIFNPIFVPIDPDIIKDIMQKSFEHFNSHFAKIPNPTLFTKGLFHQEGEVWRDNRKKLTPTFTSGKMKMMFDTFLEKTTGLEKLAGEIAESGKEANIKEILGRFTTDVIGSCGFGLECNCLKNPDSDFFKHGKNIFDPPEKKETFLGIILRALRFRVNRKDLTDTENFFRKVVTETIDYREKHKLYRKDFMHLMIQLKNRGVITDDEHIFNKTGNGNLNTAHNFTVDEITSQCMLFFVAGYETSATTMTFALLELAQNQDIQEKVRQEANAVLEKYNGKMTYEAMVELKYTEKVIEETLRKYPPVAVLPRACTKDYKIPGTNSIINKGTQTFIPVWGLHMDPEYFPNPNKFDPERFSEENKKNIKEFSYIPFGEGPRMCLGLRFGMMQSKVGLFSLVRKFNFTLNKNTTFPLKMKRDTIITAVDGEVWVNIRKV